MVGIRPAPLGGQPSLTCRRLSCHKRCFSLRHASAGRRCARRALPRASRRGWLASRPCTRHRSAIGSEEASMRHITDFEHRREKVIPRRKFFHRLARALAIWFAVTLALVIGMAGYGLIEGMPLVDAYLNAAMILSGMGPVEKLHTTGGKIF